MSNAGQSDQLATLLRDRATRASEVVGGGCALVFAAAPGEDGADAASRLRSAAGFESPDAARAVGNELLPHVRVAVETGKPQDASIAERPRTAAGVCLLPLQLNGRTLGVLAVGSAAPLETGVRRHLEELAAETALQLDYLRLAGELDDVRSTSAAASLAVQDGTQGDRSDELLKLSEELFAQDIELLRNTEKLGKIEKLKNDFIEKMSRELRTPLNSIIESIIAVIAGENEHLSEQSVSSLRHALEEGTAFQRTLQNILDLWRIKQNELPVEIQDLNFAEVVEEAIFSVQETLGSKPVSVEKNFPEVLPKLCTDLAKVNQILFLLLDNAAKFTEQGTITISAELRGDELVCSVEDTGIGICPDDQALVFDEFFQVDDLTSAGYRGAGLGLALVRDLLVVLDGEIALDSEAGKGTTMTFTIPVKPI